MPGRLLFGWALLILPYCPTQTSAQVIMLQPASVTTNMGVTVGPPTLTIDQSGLSIPYTSGVTDFDAYLASNPTHNHSLSTTWYSTFAVTTGNVDYNLGSSFTVSRLVLWNAPPFEAIQDFTIFASNESTFANPINLGSFTALAGDPPEAGPAEVFPFPATDAQFFRLQITSNHGNPLGTGLGEAAFGMGAAAVPESSTIVLMGLLGVCASAIAVRRRRMNTADIARE